MSKSDNDRNEIRMSSIPPKTHQELSNIAENLGIPVSSLVKTKLPDIVNSYPEKMRQSPPKN